MSIITSFNLALNLWGCVICAISAFSVYYSPFMKKGKKNIILGIFLTVVLVLLSYTGTIFTEGNMSLACVIGARLFDFMNYALSYVLAYGYVYYLLREIRGKRKPKVDLIKLFRWAIIADMALLLVSQFTGIYYYFDEFNDYHRGSLFWLSQGIPILMFVAAFGILVYNRKKVPKETRVYFFTDLIILAVFLVTGIIWTRIAFNNLGMVIVTIHYFIHQQQVVAAQQVAQEQKLRKKDQELNDASLQIMLSQLQPHFLYNTLNTIYYLCETDYEVAQETVRKFAEYLRTNLSSLNSRELITLEEEMHHVRAYLWIEQLRFEDRLKVVYDIEGTCRLPVLSLQPIVENAVEHGICRKPEGGTVTITVREHADGCQITVKDDGVGFDVKKLEEKGAKTSFSSVRERLSGMCGGVLTVRSEPGAGTEVTIRIPRFAPAPTGQQGKA